MMQRFITVLRLRSARDGALLPLSRLTSLFAADMALGLAQK